MAPSVCAEGKSPCPIVDDTAGRVQVKTQTESEVVDQQSTGPGRPEELLRLFDLSHDLMAIIGRDGYFRHVNPAWESVLGWSLEELKSRRAVELVHPDDLQSTLDLYGDESDGDGEVFGFENRYRCKDGGYRWLLWSARTEGKLWYAVAKDVTDRKKFERRAQLDSLTGLPNRSTLTDRLGRALERESEAAGSVVLAFIDIDRLKAVNDGFGHEVGDRLLAAIAERLEGCLRDGDVVSRFGGDEFVVVVEGGRRPAPELGDRLIAALEDPFVLAGEQFDVGVSIGISVSQPRGGPEELLRQADTAMYEAKARGGKRWALFDEEMRRAVTERRRIEIDMRHVLSRRELRLYYQPIVSLAEGAQVGLEALLRWDHPTRGLLLPELFVPVAEENGQIVPLGDWVLAEALRQVRVWWAEGWNLTIAVNVSPRQLDDGRFAEKLAEISGEAGLPPQALCIELTESSLMADIEGTVPILERLRRMGVRIAVDDFGRGFSSLSYLKNLPIDVIKIDRSFTADVVASREDRAVISAILSLSESLGISVVAEGVETEEQLGRLLELGCPLGQGFYFAGPAPPDQVELEDSLAAASPGFDDLSVIAS
jgi:diguanylate cyclase (GGDEF)-like protein/PAS domain S-box-containing protein